MHPDGADYASELRFLIRGAKSAALPPVARLRRATYRQAQICIASPGNRGPTSRAERARCRRGGGARRGPQLARFSPVGVEAVQRREKASITSARREWCFSTSSRTPGKSRSSKCNRASPPALSSCAQSVRGRRSSVQS